MNTGKILILGLILGAVGVPSRAQAEDFLSAPEQGKILRLIDSVCGDTWCEGDFGYRFDSFRCDAAAAKCRLDFEMTAGAMTSPVHQVSCSFNGIRRMSDLMNGGGFSLNADFYSQLDFCIDALGARLKR